MGTKNLVILLGRLTRDPERKDFASGGAVAQFGFAVTGERKKNDAGEWEDQPCFLDCKAWNREKGRKMADLVMENCSKGKELMMQGHLVLEQWTTKDGEKRQAIKVIVDDIQFVGKKEDNGGGGGGKSKPKKEADEGGGGDDDFDF